MTPISYEEWCRQLADAVEPTEDEILADQDRPDETPLIQARLDALTDARDVADARAALADPAPRIPHTDVVKKYDGDRP